MNVAAHALEARRARVAVAAVFFTNGALFATAIPRYPELKGSLGLSNSAWGSAVAAFPLGALVAGLFAAKLIRRLGSARVAALGIVVLASVIALLPLAGSWAALATVLGVGGALDAVIDVAQNAHGLRVQRLYGRSIVNAFHGVWSVGGVTGGLLGSAAAGLGVPLSVHLGGSALLFSAVALVARPFMLPGAEDAERTVDESPPARCPLVAAPSTPAAIARAPTTPAAIACAPTTPAATNPVELVARDADEWRGAGDRRRRTSTAVVTTLAALGVLAACGAIVEDAAASWGALFMTSAAVGALTAIGGLAFVAFQASMTVGRFLGDRLIDRFGARRVVRSGGLLAAAAMSLAALVPSVGTALVGYSLAGIGVATLVPASMHAADELDGLSPGTGLTVVSWLLRVGFLLSAPLVGVVADATSLRIAPLGVVLAGVVVVVVGRVLSPRRASAAVP